jgi:hypothetical protein
MDGCGDALLPISIEDLQRISPIDGGVNGVEVGAENGEDGLCTCFEREANGALQQGLAFMDQQLLWLAKAPARARGKDDGRDRIAHG